MAEHRMSIRRRRLSTEIRKARQDAGLTIEQAAALTEWSMGKISNIETGVRLHPTVMEIRGLLDVYGVTDEGRRTFVMELTRRAREKGWWTKYGDVFTDDYPEVEAEAARIENYELAIIPGLLQSPAYVRLQMRASLQRNADKVERVVETRRERQQRILDGDTSPELWAVIDEAALERIRPHADVYREQLQHLIDMSEADNGVTIQVLPFASGMHAGLRGPFVILTFAEGIRPVVYLETDTDGLYLEEAEEADRYRNLFDHVRAHASYPDVSLQLLKGMLT